MISLRLRGSSFMLRNFFVCNLQFVHYRTTSTYTRVLLGWMTCLCGSTVRDCCKNDTIPHSFSGSLGRASKEYSGTRDPLNGWNLRA
jgi:hypothetical protein